MSRAALALTEITGDKSYIAAGGGMGRDPRSRTIGTSAAGGYFFTAGRYEGCDPAQQDRRRSRDPVGQCHHGRRAGAALLSDRQGSAYRDRADALVGAFAGEIGRNFFPLASFINAQTFLQKALQVVIAGQPGAPDTAGAAGARCGAARCPISCSRIVGPGETLPEGHPAHGKGTGKPRTAARPPPPLMSARP